MTAPPLREQALLLGPRRALVGILTPPAEGAPARDVTIVILNSGIIHRVGANRLHVQLARNLAAVGFRVLRFDLSGVGDSPPREEARASILDAVMDDIREAVDQVVGADGRVALFGLCSGAAHALLYAPDDPRVTGLVLLDLWIPQTPRYHRQQYWNRLTSRRGWTKLLSGRLPLNDLLRRFPGEARGLLGLPPTSLHAEANGSEESDPILNPAKARRMIAESFAAMIGRPAPMLAVFTAGLEDQHNYSTQLLDAFPELHFGDTLRLEWFSDSGHTFSAEPQRKRMIELVVSWAQDLGKSAPRPTGARHAARHAAFWLTASLATPLTVGAALLDAL